MNYEKDFNNFSFYEIWLKICEDYNSKILNTSGTKDRGLLKFNVIIIFVTAMSLNDYIFEHELINNLNDDFIFELY